MDTTTKGGENMSEVQISLLGSTKEEVKRAAVRERCRRYRERHPEKRKEICRRYVENNLEKVRAQKVAYKQRNRETVLAKERIIAKRRYHANPEKYRTLSRLKARKLSPEYKLAQVLRWRKTQLGRACAKRAKARRRARLREIICTLTASEWQQILVAYNFSCAYCERSDVPMTQDHVTPISKGGHHTKENIVPACRSCNAKKNNRLSYVLKTRVPPTEAAACIK